MYLAVCATELGESTPYSSASPIGMNEAWWSLSSVAISRVAIAQRLLQDGPDRLYPAWNRGVTPAQSRYATASRSWLPDRTEEVFR